MARFLAPIFLVLAVVSALPYDHIIRKLDDGPRFQYVPDGDGTLQYVDMWVKTSDIVQSSRFNPHVDNVYHLFTRKNPSVSQPLITDTAHLSTTNYDTSRRTVVLVHGWRNTLSSGFITVMVPAFLAAEDVNVILVDWTIGAAPINYFAAVRNTVTSGKSVATFMNWLMGATGADPSKFHIVGHSLGGHQAGIIGRNLEKEIAYITALDPAFPGWILNADKFKSTDAIYTEVMHTNVGRFGYIQPLGDVDFYPNGGLKMPGCDSDSCDHDRCFFYMAESLTTGGFTGYRCDNYISAMAGVCSLFDTLPMGGLVPKTGSSGTFYLETNAAPPFARG